MKRRERARRDGGTPRRGQGGFSLIEILMSIVVIGVLATLMYPSIKSLAANDAVSVSTRVVRLVNKAKSQARRRNRAYVIRFSDMSRSDPQGVIAIYEGLNNSCWRAAETPDGGNLVRAIPFGAVTKEEIKGSFAGYEYNGEIKLLQGLSGWRLQGGNFTVNDLDLCVNPTGAISWIVGGEPKPITKSLELQVQGFDGDGRLGAPRSVEITFGGGARLTLEERT